MCVHNAGQTRRTYASNVPPPRGWIVRSSDGSRVAPRRRHDELPIVGGLRSPRRSGGMLHGGGRSTSIGHGIPTALPGRSFLPGGIAWRETRGSAFLGRRGRVTCPSRQCASRRSRFACGMVLSFRLGTVQTTGLRLEGRMTLPSAVTRGCPAFAPARIDNRFRGWPVVSRR